MLLFVLSSTPVAQLEKTLRCCGSVPPIVDEVPPSTATPMLQVPVSALPLTRRPNQLFRIVPVPRPTSTAVLLALLELNAIPLTAVGVLPRLSDSLAPT